MRHHTLAGLPAGRNARRRLGLTLIEATLVLGVVALVFGGFAQLLSDSSESMRARGSADRLRQVAKAAEQFTNAYASEIKAKIGPNNNAYVAIPIVNSSFTSTVSLSTPSVQAAGFLPAYFTDRNPYNHYHALIVHNVPTGSNNSRLEAIVTTVPAGTAGSIPDRQLGKLAQLVGGMGGYRLTTSLASAGDNVIGVGGGWRLNPGQWTAGGISPRKGTAQAALSVGDGGVLSDYLNRNDIGVPEANTMRATMHVSTPSSGETLNIKQDGTDQTVRVGPKLQVPETITAGSCSGLTEAGDIQACNNINAAVNITSGNDITAGNQMSAYAFNDRTIAQDFTGKNRGFNINDPDATYWRANPSHTTTLRVINMDELELSSVVSGDRFRKVDGEEILRLRDMLPRYVAKEGYAVTPEDAGVPKPICKGGGDPRVFLSPMQDSFEVKTEDFIKVQNDLKQYLYWDGNGSNDGLRKQGVQSMSCSNGTCNAVYGDFTGGDNISTVPAVTAINTAPIKFFRQYVARDIGTSCLNKATGETTSCWQISLSGTAQTAAVPWKALAMTYCYH